MCILLLSLSSLRTIESCAFSSLVSDTDHALFAISDRITSPRCSITSARTYPCMAASSTWTFGTLLGKRTTVYSRLKPLS